MIDRESYLEQDNLRLEVGILQNRIHAFIPEYGKFKIPTLMEEHNYNGSESSDDIYFELYVPYHLTFDWGSEWVLPGTRFIIASTAGNTSDMRVVARYDRNESVPNPSHKLAQYIIQLIMLKAREQAIFDFLYDNDCRIACHHAASPSYADVGSLVPNNYPFLDYDLFKGPYIDEDKINYKRGIRYA